MRDSGDGQGKLKEKIVRDLWHDSRALYLPYHCGDVTVDGS